MTYLHINTNGPAHIFARWVDGGLRTRCGITRTGTLAGTGRPPENVCQNCEGR